MHYKHNIHNKAQTSTMKLIFPAHTNALKHSTWPRRGYSLIGMQHSFIYIYNMIQVMVKTYVTNLPFTVQPQLPQKKVISTSHRTSAKQHVVQACTVCKERNIYTYIFIYVRNMTSLTLNTSVTYLTFTINPKGPKMKLGQRVYRTYHQTSTQNKHGSSAHGNVYL